MKIEKFNKSLNRVNKESTINSLKPGRNCTTCSRNKKSARRMGGVIIMCSRADQMITPPPILLVCSSWRMFFSEKVKKDKAHKENKKIKRLAKKTSNIN